LQICFKWDQALYTEKLVANQTLDEALRRRWTITVWLVD
jgi:hypothetical protein